MATGSFAHGVLAALEADDVERMLTLDESLFVEHKRGLGKQEAHRLVRAVAAFANTAGGWVLIGVHDGAPVPDPEEAWLNAASPTLVDAVRERLRAELDPLPAFEAKVVHIASGPIGVVRVYESFDTPHVHVPSGGVFVREVAGDAEPTKPRRAGAGAASRRAFESTQIRSRGQLIELTERARGAHRRVSQLLDLATSPPLIRDRVGPRVELGMTEPTARRGGEVHVRLAPFTLSPAFRAWATTADGAAAVLLASEHLTDFHGATTDHVEPDPSGAWRGLAMRVPVHFDAVHGRLEASARVALDGAGVAAAALQLEPPEQTRRGWTQPHDIAERIIRPPLMAAASVLGNASVVGRARLQVDIVQLGGVLLIEGGANRDPRSWVPYSADVDLPLDDDAVKRVTRSAVYAFARSAGIRAWDPPLGA